MSENKYIVLQNDFDIQQEYAVVFHRSLSHKAVAEGIVRAMANNEWGPKMYLEPVSAGFIDGSTIRPKKGSESLNLAPRPQDQKLIALVLS